MRSKIKVIKYVPSGLPNMTKNQVPRGSFFFIIGEDAPLGLNACNRLKLDTGNYVHLKSGLPDSSSLSGLSLNILGAGSQLVIQVEDDPE